MIEEINSTIPICGTDVHIYNISMATGDPGTKKSYYQHRHPGVELHYILSGQCKVTCNGSAFDIGEKSLLLIPPETYHDVIPNIAKTKRICLSFKISSPVDAAKQASTFYNIYRCATPLICNISDHECPYIFDRMVALLEADKQDLFAKHKLLSLCANLLLELIPYVEHNNIECDIPENSDIHKDINFKIDSFLGTNFMCNNAKSKIASDLYISPRQLQRIIRKNYGMSYRQKLAETRLQIAIDLLHNSDMSINQISEILGYSCSANFSAFLKRETGKTPSQVRKEQ